MIKSKFSNTVPLFYLIEAAVNENDIKSTILRENSFVDAEGKTIKTVTADSTLQSFEIINWNTRTYPGKVVMPALDGNPKIQNDIKMQQWAGEWGHPDSPSMSRMAQMMPANTSHYIDGYRREGNLLRGPVTTAPFGYGFDMYNTIMAGRPWAFSLRAFGGVDSNNVAILPMSIITYDFVNRPSHKEAYATKGDVITVNKFTDAILKECSASMLIEADTITQELTKFVMEKSDNIQIAREIFGLYEVTGTMDGHKNIMLEGSYMNNKIKVSVPVESYIKDMYADILSI